jgi:urease accessory protein
MRTQADMDTNMPKVTRTRTRTRIRIRSGPRAAEVRMTSETPAAPPGLALLRLLQLASPALPIGAFAYSQGQEAAVAAGLIHDEDSAAGWILGLLSGPLAHQDLPLFARLHAAHAARDTAAAGRWNDRLFASRPTAELQTEDRQVGAAFARVLDTLGLSRPEAASEGPTTLAFQFARATAHFQIELRQALETFAFTWAEAQSSAAVRLVPLGQSAGLRIVARAGVAIPSAVTRALSLTDEEIGGAAPRLALLSTAHETQYSRLFRS